MATQLESVSGAWGLLLSASAGMGLVLILRWYWWRVNAWSELDRDGRPARPRGAPAQFGVDVPFLDAAFPENLFGIAAITTACWLAATFLTRPTAAPTLDRFFRRVRPGGPGWRAVAARHPDVVADAGLGLLAVRWLLGCAAVYAALFGVGWVVLGETLQGLLALGAAGVVLVLLVRALRQPERAVAA